MDLQHNTIMTHLSVQRWHRMARCGWWNWSGDTSDSAVREEKRKQAVAFV